MLISKQKTKMLLLAFVLFAISVVAPAPIFAEEIEPETGVHTEEVLPAELPEEAELPEDVEVDTEDVPEEALELPVMVADVEIQTRAQSYMVLFDPNDGKDYSFGDLQKFTVNAGAPLTQKPSTPQHPTGSFAFLGWATASDYENFGNLEDHLWDFNDPIEYNMTLYAVWGHVVAFDPNDGKIYNYPDMEKALTLANRPVSAPAKKPTNSSKAFLGWSHVGNYEDFETLEPYLWDFSNPVEHNITLYGVWGYSVLFDRNDDVIYTYDELYKATALMNKPVAQAPNPVRSGYTFKGWSTASDYENFGNLEDYLWDFSNPVEHNVTLYAVWEVATPGGGSGSGSGGGSEDNFDWNTYFKKDVIEEVSPPTTALKPEVEAEKPNLPQTGGSGAGTLVYTFAAMFAISDFKNFKKRTLKIEK